MRGKTAYSQPGGIGEGDIAMVQGNEWTGSVWVTVMTGRGREAMAMSPKEAHKFGQACIQIADELERKST